MIYALTVTSIMLIQLFVFSQKSDMPKKEISQ